MIAPPQLPKYVSPAFGSLDQLWKPGYLRSAYGAHKIDQAREERIETEIVVDCYDEFGTLFRLDLRPRRRAGIPLSHALCRGAKIFAAEKWRKGGNCEHA